MMELLEEDLTCPICCSLFDDPRVLPCSHNFCKKCLEGILEGNVRNMLWRQSPFKCPTCRKETSATGVNSLQVNYSLKGIVEKYNKIKVSPKMPVCKGHVGQPLNIFCLTDMQLICGICATRGSHTKHVFCSIEDAYAQERSAFESLFQGFETWRRGDALSRLDTLESSKRKSLQLLTKDSDKVKEFFEKLQHTLEQKKNEILSDFETMKLAVMQTYDPEINKLNTILQEQRMAFNIAEAFKDVSEPVVFLQQMQEFREKIKVIKETPLPSSNLPVNPIFKNFDTSQWERIKLVDVDKMSLPQENIPFTSKIPWSFYQIFVVLCLVGLLVYFTPTMSLDGTLFDDFSVWKAHLSSFSSCYLTESAEIADQAILYWEQVVDGVFVFSERFKNYTLVLLNESQAHAFQPVVGSLRRMSGQELVTLNVGGKTFTTQLSTIRQFPMSRLARMLDGRDQEFKLVNGQIFVDRDGLLFSYILDFLRTRLLSLPTDFSDYPRLRREANFYELDPLVELLDQELLKPKPEILEVRFTCQDTRAFFRVFGSCSSTVEMLTGRITVFIEQSSTQSWSSSSFPAQTTLLPFPPQRPSYHDLVFQCGSDNSTGNQAEARYVSIKPDNRKLANGTNVLGLLLDTLLKEGFHLVSTRTVSSEDNVECYSFERMNRPEEFTTSERVTPELTAAAQLLPIQPQKKK